jgi:hypothetical protein
MMIKRGAPNHFRGNADLGGGLRILCEPEPDLPGLIGLTSSQQTCSVQCWSRLASKVSEEGSGEAMKKRRSTGSTNCCRETSPPQRRATADSPHDLTRLRQDGQDRTATELTPDSIAQKRPARPKGRAAIVRKGLRDVPRHSSDGWLGLLEPGSP